MVIGNGNVAADVTRMLTLSARASWSAPTSPTTRWTALRESRIEEVVVLGRRGPAQAAFTSAELRELGRLDGVDLRVDPDEVELDPVSRELAGRGGHLHRAQERRAAARVRGPAGRAATPGGGSMLRFLRSPVEIRGARPRRGDRRPPQRDRARRRRRAAGAARRTTPVETIECGLVLRSVGYRAVPLPDVPFDERHFVLPNERGRVLAPDGEPLPGVYAVGWIKRGPTGILGTNKRDAEETVSCLVEDLERRRAAAPPAPGRERSTRCSPSASRTWSRSRAGGRSTASSSSAARDEQRPRVKLASREELLEVAAGDPAGAGGGR